MMHTILGQIHQYRHRFLDLRKGLMGLVGYMSSSQQRSTTALHHALTELGHESYPSERCLKLPNLVVDISNVERGSAAESLKAPSDSYGTLCPYMVIT